MARQPNDRDSDESDDLRKQLADDEELRTFLKRFLTQRDFEVQVESIQKVVATGMPKVNDSLTTLPEEPGLASIIDAQQVALVNTAFLRDLRWQQATQPFEIHDPQLPGQHARRQDPPFEETILAIPEHFVDREAALEWLTKRLESRETPNVSALRGMGGIGKTTLAAKAIRLMRERGEFPDGIVVALCQDAKDATDLLHDILTRFDPQRMAPQATGLTGLTEVASRLLRGKRALIVLDNVEPGLAVEQVISPLREMGISILITTRQVLPGTVVPIEGSYTLDLLKPEQALDLLLDAYGRGDINALDSPQRAAAERIVRLLGCHTLAVKLAGSYAANVRRELDSLERELNTFPGALALPDGDVPGIVGKVFQQSIDALPERGKRLFFSLAVFASGDFGRAAAIALARGIGVEMPEASVDVLVMRSLLDPVIDTDLPRGEDRERLRMHTLLRPIAQKGFEAFTEVERNVAFQHMADYYAAYLEHAPDNGVALDRANIIRALDWTSRHGAPQILVNLCLGMLDYWHKHWLLAESTPYLLQVSKAAETLAAASGTRQDWLNAANLQLAYAQCLRREGKPDEAEQGYNANLEARRQINDKHGEAIVLYQLGQLYRARGQLRVAEDYFAKSRAIYKEFRDRSGEAATLGYLGRIAQARGQLVAADGYFSESLALAREDGHHWGEGLVLNSLGQVALTRGQLTQAETYFNEALNILREQRDRQGEGDVLTGLSRLAIDRGQLDEADAILAQSLAIDRELPDKQGEGVDISQRALVALQHGRLDDAEALVSESLAIRRQVQDRRGEGVDTAIQGGIALARGQLLEARHLYERALAIALEVENQRGVGANYHHLGVIAEQLGEVAQAGDLLRQSLAIARAVESEPDIARGLLSLGQFLIVHQGSRDEGCNMVAEAARLYQRMGRREAAHAEETVAKLGCARRG